MAIAAALGRATEVLKAAKAAMAGVRPWSPVSAGNAASPVIVSMVRVPPAVAARNMADRKLNQDLGRTVAGKGGARVVTATLSVDRVGAR